MSKTLPDRFIQRVGPQVLRTSSGAEIQDPQGNPITMEQIDYYDKVIFNDKRLLNGYGKVGRAVRCIETLLDTKVGGWIKVSGEDHKILMEILNDPTPAGVLVNTPQGLQEIPDQPLRPLEQRSYYKFSKVIMDAPTEIPTIAETTEAPAAEAVAN